MPPLIVFPSPDLLDRLAALGTPRLTVAEYHAMHDAGLLMEGDRVELLDGYLVDKPTRNPPHDVALQRLTKRLIRLGLVGWEVRIQSAVSFQESEPEPDAALVRGDDTTFQARHPGPADTGIVIEVSDSSLLFDRRVKGRMYAKVGIPTYWINNLVDGHIEVSTAPDPAASPPSYGTQTDYLPGHDVPIVLDGVAVASIPVADLSP
jgi:hypothetical protein